MKEYFWPNLKRIKGGMWMATFYSGILNKTYSIRFKSEKNWDKRLEGKYEKDLLLNRCRTVTKPKEKKT